MAERKRDVLAEQADRAWERAQGCGCKHCLKDAQHRQEDHFDYMLLVQEDRELKKDIVEMMSILFWLMRGYDLEDESDYVAVEGGVIPIEHYDGP